MTDPKESIRIGGPPSGPAPVLLVASPKKRLRWEIPITVAAVGVVLALGVSAVGHFRSHGSESAGASVPSASPSASPAPADPHGQKACQLNREAASQDRLGDDATLLRILNEGKQSASFDIRFSAQMVYDSQVISNAAEKNNSGDLELLLAGHKASIEMQTACVKQGFA